MLKNKVVVITGSTSGMGKTTAIEMAAQGAKVVITGRREKEGERIALAINKKGGKAIFVQLDVLDEESVKNLAATVKKKWKQIDVLWNNAGIELQKTINSMTSDEWSRVINVNLKGMFLTTKYCLPLMKKGASIINTASTAGLIGYPMLSAYCASKGGVIAFTRATAMELASKGIRANAICPGPIETPMIARYVKESPNPAETKKQLASTVPLGRMGKTTEIASLVSFLGSSESSFITGAVIPIDGGTTAQ